MKGILSCVRSREGTVPDPLTSTKGYFQISSGLLQQALVAVEEDGGYLYSANGRRRKWEAVPPGRDTIPLYRENVIPF